MILAGPNTSSTMSGFHPFTGKSNKLDPYSRGGNSKNSSSILKKQVAVATIRRNNNLSTNYPHDGIGSLSSSSSSSSSSVGFSSSSSSSKENYYPRIDREVLRVLAANAAQRRISDEKWCHNDRNDYLEYSDIVFDEEDQENTEFHNPFKEKEIFCIEIKDDDNFVKVKNNELKLIDQGLSSNGSKEPIFIYDSSDEGKTNSNVPSKDNKSLNISLDDSPIFVKLKKNRLT